ncbi:MAG: hypothetical protein CL916_12740 [Deltaproteobacteria bacterium]|nr:hypothetical protein [Deltaproteobacteria bacterium]
MNVAIQISPQSKSAYFQSYIDVAQKELAYLCKDVSFEYACIGTLEFLFADVEEDKLWELVHLSFVQGLYAQEGRFLIPLEVLPKFSLHEDFVFGSKYRGKTNETLTQLLLNVGLATIRNDIPESDTVLLDPMCGRGTSLLWALRYGIDSFGLEIDPKAMDDIQRHLKKWTKIHRQKHSFRQSFLGVKPNKKKQGVCIDFQAEQTAFKAVHGDCRSIRKVFKERTFSLIVTDIPYGIQHHVGQGTRNPLNLLRESIPVWGDSLQKGGAMVIAFNRNIPKRNALLDVCIASGLDIVDFSIPHRMSESIVRDVMICKKG